MVRTNGTAKKLLSYYKSGDVKLLVFYFQGISDSAQAFLDYRHQKSTAFELNNAGFDVWMINARGNVFSRHHINMTVDDPSFWDFR